MSVVPGHFQKGIERGLEVFTQLLMPGVVVLTQHVAGETFEFPRVVVSRGQTGYQCLSEAATAECRNAGGQNVLRRTSVNAYGLAVEAQLAGVAGGAGDVQKLIRAARVLMTGEAHGQVTGVVGRGFLPGIDQKTEACEVLRSGKSLLRKRQFERVEPVVAQAFDLSALGREVVGLAVSRAPLLQVMHLLRRRPGRQFRVGDVIQNHGQAHAQQHNDQNQQAIKEAQDKHPCRFVALLCLSRRRAASGHYAK